MKVLFVTSHITNNTYPIFLRNQTGFGYMVFDIAKNMAHSHDIDLFVANTYSEDISLEGVHIIARSWRSYLSGLRYGELINGLKFIHKYRLPLKRRLRELYMYTTVSQIQKRIKGYDIVHIHGCGTITDAMIRICKKANVPFLVTLHGLNSFEDSIKLPTSLKQHERDFLKEAASESYAVSFISTGNKEAVEKFVGKKVESFKVICNGTDITKQERTENIREKYNISKDDFLFAFVGNISKNKNQIQVARAWQLLPDDTRERCKVIFVGGCQDNNELANYIESKKLSSNLILCGIQPKDNVHNFYQDCNATILTSLTEGFGLSVIEGYVYGKPCVTFADLPAFSDIYDNKSTISIEERTDVAVAKAMATAMSTVFDKEYIMAFSQKFSFEQMAINYDNYYEQINK